MYLLHFHHHFLSPLQEDCHLNHYQVIYLCLVSSLGFWSPGYSWPNEKLGWTIMSRNCAMEGVCACMCYIYVVSGVIFILVIM